VLNTHLIWASKDEKLSVTFEIMNALNKFYWLDTFNTYAQAGYIGGTPSLPRTYFFSIKRSF
jgi:outer membrane receptor protein involved in Fe transport